MSSNRRFAERSMMPILFTSIVVSSSITYFVTTNLNAKLEVPPVPEFSAKTKDDLAAAFSDDAERVEQPSFDDAEDRELVAREARRRIRKEMNEMDRTAAKYAFEKAVEAEVSRQKVEVLKEDN